MLFMKTELSKMNIYSNNVPIKYGAQNAQGTKV